MALVEKPSIYKNYGMHELENVEIKDPYNPELKWYLAKAYFCNGKRAFAFELWRWIEKFSNEEHYKNSAKKAINYRRVSCF